MHRFELESAYILHTRPYQETSLLLEIFTQNHGRMGVIAKGAKRPKSRARGTLQPFVPLLLSCVGRGELLTLTAFDRATIHHNLSGRRLMSGFYLNELLMRLLHRFDAHSDLFLIYRNTLCELETEKPEQIILRLFEKRLLKILGYELQLATEVETKLPVEANLYYVFDPLHGPKQLESSLTKAGNIDKIPGLFKGKTLLALQEENLQDETLLNDIKRLMRLALLPHLGTKPLESRRLFV